MKYTLDTNIFIDSFRSEEAQGQLLDENPSLLNDALIAASCRELGITLVTKDGDFKRFKPFLRGLRTIAPWPGRSG